VRHLPSVSCVWALPSLRVSSVRYSISLECDMFPLCVSTVQCLCLKCQMSSLCVLVWDLFPFRLPRLRDNFPLCLACELFPFFVSWVWDISPLCVERDISFAWLVSPLCLEYASHARDVCVCVCVYVHGWVTRCHTHECMSHVISRLTESCPPCFAPSVGLVYSVCGVTRVHAWHDSEHTWIPESVKRCVTHTHKDE